MRTVRRATGALSRLAGEVSTGGTWHEDIEIREAGAAIPGADSWEWRFTFRCSDDAAPSLTLSTTDGRLNMLQGSSSTIMQIRVPPADMSNMDGDYVADLSSMDGDGEIIHWSHGIVTFLYEPVWK